jgi:uncharacterized protein (TIRG00374 family)
MKTSRKHLALLALKLAVSALLLGLVLSRINLGEIVARIKSFDWRISVLALTLWMLNLFFASWRWSILSLRLIPLGQAIRYTWIGFFFGSVLPGAVAGDVAKGVSLGLKDKTQQAERLTASIFLDKLVGFFTLLVFFNVAASWLVLTRPEVFGRLRPLVLACLLGGMVALLALIFCWRLVGTPRLDGWIEALPSVWVRKKGRWLAEAFAPYQHHGLAILAALGLSAIVHSVVILVYWIMFAAVEPGISIIFAAVYYPLLSIILVAPVSISGIGLRDAFAAMMFTAFGLHPDAGVAVSWLMLALNVPIVAIGGLVQIAELFRRTRPTAG